MPGASGVTNAYTVSSGNTPAASPKIDTLTLPAGSYILTLSYTYEDNEGATFAGYQAGVSCFTTDANNDIYFQAEAVGVMSAKGDFFSDPSATQTFAPTATTTLITTCSGPYASSLAGVATAAPNGRYLDVNLVAVQVDNLHTQ